MRIAYKIVKEYSNLTIREYFLKFHLGKPKIAALFLEESVFVNQEKKQEDYVLRENDILEILYKEEVDFIPDNKKLDIVYEDDYLLIVNKPIHILVHPDDKNKQGTVCNIVSQYYKNKGLECSVKYAHRLDMDTTGILIFVKDALTHAKIDEMIQAHTLKRVYYALALGRFKDKMEVIDAPIGEDRHHQQRKRISKTGKRAITEYEVLKEYKRYSLVKLVLKTGRTHQIRVHLASLGHPVLGDKLYGENSNLARRTMLHSYQVDFIHPVTRERLVLTKELPFDMRELLK